MATGVSEETFEFTCTPCCKDGKQVEANIYCENCRECLCDVCFKFHQRSSATLLHSVLDKAAIRAGGAANMPSLPTDTCDTHPGKVIVLFCKDHDALCCVECASSEHMSCSSVYIPEASIGFRDCSQLKDQTDSTNDLAVDLDKMKIGKESELKQLQRGKNKTLAEVQSVENDIIKRIKELTRASVDIVKQAYCPIEATLEAELDYLEGVKSDTQPVLDGIGSSVTNEAQLFVNEIRARRHNTDMKNNLTNKSSQKYDIGKFLFFTKKDITETLDRLKAMQTMVEKTKIYSVKLKGDYNVRTADDKATCDIVGSCQLPDGTVVITDWNNKRLKRLDASYSVTDHCDMPHGPWGVTCTAPDEVVVTITNQKKVQFVSVRGSMSLSRSFTTSDRCRGILYSRGKLYVACGGQTKKGLEEGPGHVTNYTLKGEQLNKVQTGLDGQNMFSCPYHITTSCDGDKIYLAQNEGGVVMLNRDGTLDGFITDPSLATAFGLCTLANGHILVCGRDSNNVLQFHSDGRKVTELLKDTEGIKEPRLLCYDRKNCSLIVTLKETDNIRVFDLK